MFNIPDLFVPASILAVALAIRLIPWDTSAQVSDNNDDVLE